MRPHVTSNILSLVITDKIPSVLWRMSVLLLLCHMAAAVETSRAVGFLWRFPGMPTNIIKISLRDIVDQHMFCWWPSVDGG